VKKSKFLAIIKIATNAWLLYCSCWCDCTYDIFINNIQILLIKILNGWTIQLSGKLFIHSTLVDVMWSHFDKQKSSFSWWYDKCNCLIQYISYISLNNWYMQHCCYIYSSFNVLCAYIAVVQNISGLLVLLFCFCRYYPFFVSMLAFIVTAYINIELTVLPWNSRHCILNFSPFGVMVKEY